MLDLKNNPVFSKKPYYDEDSNVCVLLSEKAIFSPLGRIDRRAFVLLILIDILMYFASFCILMLWDKLTGLGLLDNKFAGLSYFLMCNYLMFVIVSKRLHDIGKSMGLSLLYVMTILISLLSDKFSYIPYFIAIVMIILACIPGEKRDNAYGARVEILKLCSDNIIKGKINHNIECPNINFNIARGFNAVKNVISNNVLFSILKNNKKKLGLTLIVFILVGCAGYYLYIPKMSDVERYRDNKDAIAMNNFIDKPILFEEKDPKYKAVRDQAIIALADMNTPEGNKFLEAYLYSDDQKIDLALKKGIFKALAAKNEDFLHEYVDTCLKETKKGKMTLYDQLLYVTRDEDLENSDFVERKIVLDIVSNTNGSDIGSTYIDFIKNKNFKCAQKISDKDRYTYQDKLTYFLSGYIETYSELEGFDERKTREIDKQIDDIRRERKQIEFYLRNVDEVTRKMVNEIYVTQGINKALEYHNQVSKDAINKVNRYWKLESELEKLNYKKKNLQNEKHSLEWQKQWYYKRLKEFVGNNVNLPKDLLGINWDDPSAYISKLKFELRSDGGLLVYRDSNAKAVPLRTTDCLPDGIDVLSSRFVLNKRGTKIVSIELECSSNDWNTIYKYLSDKYGSTSSPLDEASKTRYRSIWLGYDKAIDLLYYKGDAKLILHCDDKETLFSS